MFVWTITDVILVAFLALLFVPVALLFLVALILTGRRRLKWLFSRRLGA